MNVLESGSPFVPLPAAKPASSQQTNSGSGAWLLLGFVAAAVAVVSATVSAASEIDMTRRAVCFVVSLAAYAFAWLLYTGRRVSAQKRNRKHRMPAWSFLRLIALVSSVGAAWLLAEAYAL